VDGAVDLSVGPDGTTQAAATPLQLPAGNPWGSAPPIFPPAPAHDAGQPAPPKPPSALPDWMKPFVTAPPPPLFLPQAEPNAGSPENLKRTFEQDPLGVAGDLSTLFAAGAPLAGVRAAGVLGRAGEVAGTVERAGAASGAASGEIRSAIDVAREGAAGAAGDIGSALKAKAPAADAAAVVAKELPALYFDRAVMPNIVAHIEKAIADGKPDVLTRVVDNDAKIAKRKAALKGLPELPATHSWDEYPFASVREGGKGASTAPVLRPEQHRQGGTMSEFYRNNNVGHNDQFRVGISPPP
jgi:hypothetical protein